MADLTFYYGTMGSGKSIDIQKVAYNYEEGGKKVLLFTSAIDNRFGEGLVASRIGLKRPAIILFRESKVLSMLEKLFATDTYDCLLIDEAQFLTEEQVKDFWLATIRYNVPVKAYGLKNDFQNNLFEGSKALLQYADKLEEITTVCLLCPRPANMVLRIENGKPVYEGPQIKVGGNESYITVCKYCWLNPDLTKLRRSGG